MIRPQLNSMSLFSQNLTELNLILEVLKKLEERQERTLELQEGENQQIIREFRVRMINKLLEAIKSIN
jgi:hypothetical protein